jgi:hypothetical protein
MLVEHVAWLGNVVIDADDHQIIHSHDKLLGFLFHLVRTYPAYLFIDSHNYGATAI